jgi:hypothetical protein
MPRDDVELVRRMYAAFHGGDAERAVSYFDEVRDDAITRMTLYGRPAEALRAAGLEAPEASTGQS